MKKTLLATAIIGALGASAAAQAATVYDEAGTKLEINGRIAMGIAGGGPEAAVDTNGDGVNDSVESNSAEFVDVYSRLGLSMSHELNSDLTAFGRVEWRFRGDERTGSGRVVDSNGDSINGFSEVRHSYIGLRSNSWGTVQAGNYDSFYNSYVAAPFDLYIDRGLEFTDRGIGGAKQARGDSFGYVTPDLQGFTAFISGKHFSDRGEVEPTDGSEFATQGGAMFETGPVRLALGYVDDISEGGGNDEILYGATASYAINDAFSARLGYETRDENDTLGGGYDTVGLGGSYNINQWTFHADIYDVNPDDGDSRTSWALGSYYNLSSNFNIFLELQQADQQSISVFNDGGDIIETADGDDAYWLTGARYHF
ncbi:porin [Halomonas sp. QHL1]|uniref:porin n=1 Tax=Halomonas sp. QHL1 TaxID=1123773 RepID=UPI0008FD7E08|nr:porin [Halomonas sp. QHL1]OJA03956.1 porin [Halomonas sp. QHL1]